MDLGNVYENTDILKRQPDLMRLLLEVHYTACEVFFFWQNKLILYLIRPLDQTTNFQELQ